MSEISTPSDCKSHIETSFRWRMRLAELNPPRVWVRLGVLVFRIITEIYISFDVESNAELEKNRVGDIRKY